MNEMIYIEKELKDNAFLRLHYSEVIKEADIKITQKTCVNHKFKTLFQYKMTVSYEVFQKISTTFLFKENVDKSDIISFLENCSYLKKETFYDKLMELIEPFMHDFLGYDETNDCFNIVLAVKEILEMERINSVQNNETTQ